MSRLSIGLIYILGMLVLPAVFFPACTGPGISVESGTGFTHEASVHIPFHPPDDAAASLQIDDEGTAVFTNYIEIHHGNVNPEKSTSLRFIRQIKMEL